MEMDAMDVEIGSSHTIFRQVEALVRGRDHRVKRAFWMDPDWQGGDNLRSGAVPFWMYEPLPYIDITDAVSDIVRNEYILQNRKRISAKLYRELLAREAY